MSLNNGKYMDIPHSQQLGQAGIYLIGMPFDGTACFRKGARLGPSAIREISYGIEDYSPYLDRELSLQNLYDLGDIPFLCSLDIDEQYLKALQEFDLKTEKFSPQTKLLTLGGEHSISYAPLKKYLSTYPDLVVLHLDAHADLRDGYEGHYYSHASIIRRALDHFVDGHQLIQYGIRSGTRNEYQWMKNRKTLCRSREEFLEKIDLIPDQRPVYLTLDLDYFDPAYFPGTGTPEAGGEDFHSFIKLIKILDKKNFVGADVTELAPELDSSGNSSVFAAKVVRELLICLGEKNGK